VRIGSLTHPTGGPAFSFHLQSYGSARQEQIQIVTAIGGELLGFIWAIAVETEKQHPLAKAA